MNKPTKIAIGAGLLVAAFSWAPAADNDNPDAFKLPDRAQAYATDDAVLRQAQAQQDQAKADVIRARQQVVAQSLASQEYKQAVERVESTNDKYQSIKRQVQADLTRNDPQYLALLKDRALVDQELATARGNPNTPYATYQELYAKKEKSTNALRELEDSAMDKAGGATARADWTAACKALDDLKKTQRAQVESAPQVAAAKEKAANTQQSVDQAATKLAGSQAAYDEASYQQGKQDDYNYHHQGDSLDYWDSGWYGGYGYRGVAVYRGGGGARPRR